MKGEEKLLELRKLMKERGYDAYIIPHGDQHDNEYIAEADERIKFISNFSGSNGRGLVTKDVALMWTDGRYYIQIEKELYPGWKIKKMGLGEESLTQYISKNLPKGIKIGMDFNLFSESLARGFKNILIDYEFVDDSNNIIDIIWGDLKPKYSPEKVIIIPVKYTGLSALDKYKTLDTMVKKKLNITNNSEFNYRLLISRLDDIAWLLNLRGSDIPYNPVFFSFALFYSTPEKQYVNLFVNKQKFEDLS